MKARPTKSGSAPASRAAISRQAYNVAKSSLNLADGGEGAGGGATAAEGEGRLPGLTPSNAAASSSSASLSALAGGGIAMRTESDFDQTRITKQMEDEIMGDQRSKHNQRSNAMEKNLHQMIDVLNGRLRTLGEVTTIRMRLCEDDINKDSQNTSKQAPRIGDDMDESIPRSLRDSKYANSGGNNAHLKDNLVSADTVFIDPAHLVLRTRGPTEAGKKLEANLEQCFGNMNVREMKSKKAKSQSDKTKRSEQLKNDKKRENRQRIEKKLQMVMESFVTRSAMDADLVFELPDSLSEEPDWPVSVKWIKEDPRSQRQENSDGEFNPDLLLRYSMERINLPSGRGVFAWLLRQPVVQRYFVTLFWLIKVKFFETEAEEREAFLLRLLSLEYRQIVELMANRTHAEHEKDFVYKYLPFLLCNGVYFGFYYVFPGSRHIYTKGFKKTIYMQIIRIMHGIQVCPITVRVSWAKLFPEDIHDDGGEEGEDGGEVFPVQIAFKQPRIKQIEKRRGASSLQSMTGSARSSDTEGDEDGGGGGGEEDGMLGSGGGLSPILSPNVSSTHSRSRKKLGVLTEDLEGTGGPVSSPSHRRTSTGHAGARRPGEDGNDRPGSTPAGLIGVGGSGILSGAGSLAQTPSLSPSQPSVSHGSSSRTSHKSLVDLRADELLDDRRIHRPFLATYLKPPPEKPSNLRGQLKRQNNIERINAQEVSPAMAVFLASRSDAQGLFEHHFSQTLRRTVPVQWCPAGGSDTHRRRPVNHELHNEISDKLHQSREDYHGITYDSHRKKLKSLRGLEKSMTKVLSSGSTNISRMSLDLIRRQRASRGATSPRDAAAPTAMEDIDMAEMAQLAQYDDDEIDRFIAEL